jgi:hypothetical protein
MARWQKMFSQPKSEHFSTANERVVSVLTPQRLKELARVLQGGKQHRKFRRHAGTIGGFLVYVLLARCAGYAAATSLTYVVGITDVFRK